MLLGTEYNPSTIDFSTKTLASYHQRKISFLPKTSLRYEWQILNSGFVYVCFLFKNDTKSQRNLDSNSRKLLNVKHQEKRITVNFCCAGRRIT